MTDTTTEATAAEDTPQDAPASAQDATATADATEAPATPADAADEAEPRSPNAEAAKYRTQLRATEGERDVALAHVGELQRAVIELMVGPRLQNVDDFGRHVDMASLIADDGLLDRAKITAAIDGLLTARPYLAAPVKRTPASRSQPKQGVPVQSGGGAGQQKSLVEKFGGRTDVGWGDLLHKQGEHAPTRGSRQTKVESELHRE